MLVAREGRAFTKHPRSTADFIAGLGNVAFAADYFGEVTRSLDHAFRLMNPYSAAPQLYAAHATAAPTVLQAHPRVDSRQLGAIGFCWGGFAVLEFACHADPRCVVGFHPGLSVGPVSKPESISAKILVCVDDQDPYVPAKDIEAFIGNMRAGGVD